MSAYETHIMTYHSPDRPVFVRQSFGFQFDGLALDSCFFIRHKRMHSPCATEISSVLYQQQREQFNTVDKTHINTYTSRATTSINAHKTYVHYRTQNMRPIHIHTHTHTHKSKNPLHRFSQILHKSWKHILL